MKGKIVCSAIFLFFTMVVPLSAAAENVSGVFTAVRACDAYKSFRKGTNPGMIRTTPGIEYEAVEVNNKEMEWVRIKVPDIDEPLRWVSGECGTKRLDIGGGGGGEEPSGNQCSQKNRQDSYVLAMTWQPGFCGHYSYQGRKPECDALSDGTLVLDHLTLHGLWPNRKECGTKYGNCGGPDLDLEESTISQLSPWMPNFYYEKVFGSYEWKKHGTCQQLSDDDYFLRALKLVEVVDASIVGSYIKSQIGSNISAAEFFRQVREKYGKDVAERIQLLCADKKYLQEIRINLPLEFSPDSDLGKLTNGAGRIGPQTSGCSGDSIYVERSGAD